VAYIKEFTEPTLYRTSKNSEFAQMQGAGKNFAAPHIGLYVSKKFLPQRRITSHLVAVVWQLSGMASSSIS
jgi:hypothetical protein